MWKQFMEWFSSFRKSEDVKEVASKMVHIVVEKAEQKIDQKINAPEVEAPAPAPVTEVETLPEAPAPVEVEVEAPVAQAAPTKPARKRAPKKRTAKKAAPKAK